jgi:hypothetical protein
MRTAEFVTARSAEISKIAATAQSETIAAAADSERVRIQGLQAKSDWDTKDAGFRYDRTKVAREHQIAKVQAATSRGGALNYGERMVPLRDRATLDLQEGLAKLSAAAKGLRLLYGFDLQLPQPDSMHGQFFDGCLLWVRKAINWLVRFRQLEQSYVLPILVKPLCKDWGHARATGVFEFTIPEDRFRYMKHVRLRGITVCTVYPQKDDDGAGTFEALVTAPRVSACVHLSGKNAKLDQNSVPPCRSARVAPRSRLKEPDVVGASALYNVSPIGDWKMILSTRSTTGLSLNAVQDVHLDLHLAFRASEDG